MSENKEHGERGGDGGGSGGGGGGGDWGRRGDWRRGELLEPGLFQSELVSVLQGSGSNLWRLLTGKDQWIRLWATWAQVLKEPNWSTFGINFERAFKNECRIVLSGLPYGLLFFMNADIRRAGIFLQGIRITLPRKCSLLLLTWCSIESTL